MLKLRVKKFFLDQAHIIKKIGEAKVKNLMLSSGRIRVTAQRSMRYRVKGSSAPGQPPFAHKKHGALLRKLLFFAYDPATDSVVTGPEALGKAQAPSLNEFGGKAQITKIVKRIGPKASAAQALAFRRKVKTGEIQVSPKQKLRYSATYPKRPFMAPALAVEVPRLPKQWANSVVGP